MGKRFLCLYVEFSFLKIFINFPSKKRKITFVFLYILLILLVAIDLIVQHIRDFLNNRSCHGSTSNIQLHMNLDYLNAGGKTRRGILKANYSTVPTTTSPTISNITTNVNILESFRPH